MTPSHMVYIVLAGALVVTIGVAALVDSHPWGVPVLVALIVGAYAVYDRRAREEERRGADPTQGTDVR